VRIDPGSLTPIGLSSPIYPRLDPAAQATMLEGALPADPGNLVRRDFCGAAAEVPAEL